MYISPEAPQDGAVVRLGVLYPSSSAEDDYDRLAERLGAGVRIDLVHTTIGEDAHREDALRDTGDVERLLDPARELAGRDVQAIMWACTSGSFVFGLAGAREQAQAVQRATGVPTSSTSLAFVAAAEALGVSRVALAATYPPEVTALFAGLLADAGIEVVSARSLDILTGVQVGDLAPARILELLGACDDHDAQAILVPDTALHTVDALGELERAVGKPVLTANQVTAWHGLTIAGAPVRAAGLGQLFEAPRAVCEGSR